MAKKVVKHKLGYHPSGALSMIDKEKLQTQITKLSKTLKKDEFRPKLKVKYRASLN
jgi:hypothetical protein